MTPSLNRAIVAAGDALAELRRELASAEALERRRVAPAVANLRDTAAELAGRLVQTSIAPVARPLPIRRVDHDLVVHVPQYAAAARRL